MPVQVVTDFGAMEAALVAWLATYSGLGTGKVQWFNQKAPRLTRPYGTLYVVSHGQRLGLDDVKYTYNGATGLLDRRNHGPRTMTVAAQVFSEPMATPGALDARKYLEAALMALETQVVTDAFAAAGLAFLEHEPITTPDEQLADRWERRAVADLRLLYTGAIEEVGDEGTNWIETVVTPTEDNGNLTIGT